MHYASVMTQSHDIRFLRLCKSDYSRVRHIEVAPEQIVYCGTVDMAFASDETGLDLFAITLADQPVGFFKIDLKYPAAYAFCRYGDLGLRGFMIDQPHQNCGIGSAALQALPDLLRATYPTARALVLMVNIRNQLAVRTYLKVGFETTGEMIDPGLAGPQLVLRRTLPIEGGAP